MTKPLFHNRLFVIALLMLIVFMNGTGPFIHADPPAKKKRLLIRDYRKKLNRKFKKEKRKSTRFIIVHTSEAGQVSTLRTLSQGKQVGRHRTYGGHANYVIARNGLVYRILHHSYRADHSGLSMWNGIEDLSSHSIGIELVGFHYGKITNAQYNALGLLVKKLRKMYRIPGKNVLTHSQVSYGKPNRWHRRPHRGRKRCALNFDRRRIGLGRDFWRYDPDVRARRLTSDRHIYAVFYKPNRYKKAAPPVKTTPVKTPPVKPPVTPPVTSGTPYTIASQAAATNAVRTVEMSNVISLDNSAWNIAGEDYDSPDTVYVLPGPKEIRGDKIRDSVGWDRLPRGTRVLLNQPKELENKKGPIFEITGEFTAWSYAGKAYSAVSTFYFFNNGGFVAGDRVTDWDELPAGTRMIVGYAPPQKVGAVQGQTPWSIAGRAYNQKETVYYLPGQKIITGDQVKDFNDLPNGAMIFLEIKI